MKKNYFLFSFLLISFFSYSQDCGLLTISNQYPIITSPTCGVANGAIEVKATGNGEILYSLNGNNFQTSGQFSELNDSEHIIKIKDELGCVISLTVPLEGETPVRIDKINSNNATCENNDGEIEIISEGSGLEYSINNGRNFQFSNKFVNLGAGDYNTVVRDSFGCTAEALVRIGNGNIKFDSIQRKNSECDKDEGEIKINVFDGNGLEFQLLNFRGWQSSNTFDNLPIGTYTVEVRDGRGCVIRRNISVNLKLDYQIDTNESDCDVDNGTLDVDVNSTGDYEFSFEGSGYTSQTFYENLASGTYNLKIRNKANTDCIINQNVRIGLNQTITNLNSTSTPSFCNTNNGTVTITSDGVGVQYNLVGTTTSFNVTNNTGVFENLPADTYKIILGDSNQCEVTSTIQVGESNDISDQFTTDFTASDCSSATGTIIFRTTSLSGNESYSLNGGTYNSTGEFTNVDGGSNVITVRSQNGCTKDFVVDVPEVNDISVEKITVDTPTFRCANDGRILLEAKGTNVEFSIDGINFQQNGVFIGLNAGTYIITMRNSLGCLKETGEIELVSTFVVAGFDIKPTNCYDNNGSILVVASGDGLQFQLDGGAIQNTNLFENLSPGEHTILLKDENDCEILRTVDIPNEGFVEIRDFNINPPFCGEPNGQISFTAYQESTKIEYSINGKNYKSDSLFTNLPSGEMMIWARDEFGCTDSLSVTIPASTIPVLSYKFTPSICDFNNGSVEINHTGGVGSLIYSLNNSAFKNENIFTDLSPGVYTLDIEDEVGCMVSDTIEIIRNCKALFPTVITPNGNSENDIFRINYYLPLQINKLVIYNRWGNKIYTQNNFVSTDNDKWWNGDGEQDGSFVAYVEYVLDDEIHQISTSFVILK